MNVNRVHFRQRVTPRRTCFVVWRGSASLGLALGLLGCSTGQVESDCSSPTRRSDESELTLLTWWETQSDDASPAQDPQQPPPPEQSLAEALAAKSLQDSYATCTGGALEFESKKSKEETITNIGDASKVRDGAIVNGGVDVYRLAGCVPGQTQKLSSLGPVDAPVADFLVRRTPESLRHLVTCNDQWFAALIGLHRLNVLFYDRSRLEEPAIAGALSAAGISLDAGRDLSLEDLETVLREVSRFHPRPLVIPSDLGSSSRFLLENLMVAVAHAHGSDLRGEEGYERFWGQLLEGSTEEVPTVNLSTLDEAMDWAEKLAPYIGTSRSRGLAILRNAESGTTAQAAAVFTVNGDWEVPNLTGSLAHRPFPGTDALYVYSADVLVATRTSSVLSPADAMVDLMRAVTSQFAQEPFSELKHALSAEAYQEGFTSAKSPDELFDVDGRRLRGVPSLHSYVPHLTFDDLGSEVYDYLECLIEESEIHPLTYIQECASTRGRLEAYVYEQYCNVLRKDVPGECNVRRNPEDGSGG